MKPTQNKHLSSAGLALLLLSLLLGLAEITPASLAQGRTLIYVDAGASGANSGTSWANAYTHLQDALDQTNANGTTDFEIWVAEGVYYPDEESVGSDHTADSESEYFTLSYNNVQLYGGFAGTETSRDQRDWTTHPTILSGDIDGNDLNTDGNHIAETGDDIQGDNADHVLYLDGVSNEIIDAATVIDGFIITAGQADGDDFPFYVIGGGLYCAGSDSGHECSPDLINVRFNGNVASWGGGMYNDGGSSGESSPSLVNVGFSGNWAGNSGGGMFNDGWYAGNSNPSLIDVNFSDNWAGNQGGGMVNFGYVGKSNPNLVNVSFNGNFANWDGGGMYNHGYGGESSPSLVNVSFSGNWASWGGGMFNNGPYGESSPILINVSFSDNSATPGGGGMYNNGPSGESSPSLVNVSFSGNSANEGGGMYNQGDNGGVSSPSLVNVSFSDNSANRSGGGIFNYGPSGNSSPSLVNTILWDNTATDDGPQIYNDNATPTFTHSLVEGGISGLGTDGGNNLDQDPLFVDTANGDLRLQSGSPAIDAGLTAALPVDTFDLDGDGNTTEPIPFDLAGQARNQGSAVDIGAYEYTIAEEIGTNLYLPMIIK